MSLGGGFLVLIGCAVVVTVQVYKILGDVRKVTYDAADVVGDVYSLKNGLKVLLLTFIQNTLEKAKGRGK